MNTDEGTGFLDDMTKKEVKHESDISLMNHLIYMTSGTWPYGHSEKFNSTLEKFP